MEGQLFQCTTCLKTDLDEAKDHLQIPNRGAPAGSSALPFAQTNAEKPLLKPTRSRQIDTPSLLGSDSVQRTWEGTLAEAPVPGGQLVLLFAGPGSGHGGQVVDGAHAVDGGVELLQLLPDVVELLWVWRQVAGVCLASLASPLLAWTKDHRTANVKNVNPTCVAQISVLNQNSW